MKTIDIKFSQLCNEIDLWKDEVIYWKEQAEYWQKEHSKLVNDSINHNHIMMSTVLKCMLSNPSKEKLKEYFEIE